MSKEEIDYARKNLDLQLQQSGNLTYQATMISIINAMGTQNAYKVLSENNISLDVQENQTREDIVKIFIQSMDEEAIHNYIRNLLELKKITAKNFADFLRNNEKYIGIVLEEIGNSYSRDEWFNASFLSKALQDTQMEKKILTEARKVKDPRNINSFIVTGYLGNNEVDKAVAFYKREFSKKGFNLLTLAPIDFLKKLISLGYEDTAMQYLLSDNNFRKDFNGHYNYQYEKLKELLEALLKVDHSKAIDFIIDPKIREIRNDDSDDEEFIKLLIKKKIDKDLMFKFLTSGIGGQKSLKKGENNDRLAEGFLSIIKTYGDDFVKNVLDHNNGCLGKKMLEEYDKNDSLEAFKEKIDYAFMRSLNA